MTKLQQTLGDTAFERCVIILTIIQENPLAQCIIRPLNDCQYLSPHSLSQIEVCFVFCVYFEKIKRKKKIKKKSKKNKKHKSKLISGDYRSTKEFALDGRRVINFVLAYLLFNFLFNPWSLLLSLLEIFCCGNAQNPHPSTFRDFAQSLNLFLSIFFCFEILFLFV